MRGRALSLILVALLQGHSAAQSAATPPSPAKHTIVLGNDYTFAGIPASMPAGAALFAFENRGKVRHEMSMALLQPSMTLDDVKRRMQAGEAVMRTELIDQPIGILIARPGGRTGGELWVDLQRGRTYLVICTLKDTPEAPQHAMIGMVTTFDVR
jgi:hypothetical protein